MKSDTKTSPSSPRVWSWIPQSKSASEQKTLWTRLFVLVNATSKKSICLVEAHYRYSGMISDLLTLFHHSAPSVSFSAVTLSAPSLSFFCTVYFKVLFCHSEPPDCVAQWLVLHCLVSEQEARSNILIDRLRCRLDRQAAAHQICPLLLGLRKCRLCVSQVSCFICCSSNCVVADDLIKTRSNLEKIYIHLFFFPLSGWTGVTVPDWLASTIYLQTFTLATSSNFHLLCDLLSTADSLWSH